MENTEKTRNLELIGIKRTSQALENLHETKNTETDYKIIKFKRKEFKKGKYDDVLYNVQAVNQKLLKESFNS